MSVVPLNSAAHCMHRAEPRGVCWYCFFCNSNLPPKRNMQFPHSLWEVFFQMCFSKLYLDAVLMGKMNTHMPSILHPKRLAEA